MSNRYRVVWVIDLHAETPQEAAKEAWATMQEPGSTACYFEVTDQDGNKTTVDLLEEEE